MVASSGNVSIGFFAEVTVCAIAAQPELTTSVVDQADSSALLDVKDADRVHVAEEGEGTNKKDQRLLATQCAMRGDMKSSLR